MGKVAINSVNISFLFSQWFQETKFYHRDQFYYHQPSRIKSKKDLPKIIKHLMFVSDSMQKRNII